MDLALILGAFAQGRATRRSSLNAVKHPDMTMICVTLPCCTYKLAGCADALRPSQALY